MLSEEHDSHEEYFPSRKIAFFQKRICGSKVSLNNFKRCHKSILSPFSSEEIATVSSFAARSKSSGVTICTLL